MKTFGKELSYGVGLGILATLVIVGFTSLMHLGIWGIWDYLPQQLGAPFWWPLAISLAGAVLVGLLQKYVGPYPFSMHETLQKAKQPHFYRDQIWRNCLNALVILILGAGVGPEAALVAIVTGLAVWIGDRLQYAENNSTFLLTNSLGAVLALVFTNPFFGLSEQIDHEQPQRSNKSVRHFAVYVATIASGWLVFSGLSQLVSTPFFHLRFQHFDVTWGWVPAGIVAFLLAELFSWVYAKGIKPVQKLKQIHAPIWLALLGGLVLGLSGMWSEYFLFSGEDSVTKLVGEYQHLTPVTLLILGLGKMLLAIFYNATGWRGGDIFPNVFGSVCLGLMTAQLLGLSAVACATVFGAVMLTNIMQKPLVVCGLLVLVFPLSLFPLIFVSSVLTGWVRQFVPQRN